MTGLRPSPVALVLAASLALGACAHTRLIGATGTLQLGVTEYRLNPQDVRVKAGELTIYVRNYGRLTHNLVVTRNGTIAGSTKPVAPGQSTALVLVLTPGKYSMGSTILSDEALGAYGTLTVTR